ncbi:hypothetical protein HDU98_010640, partial [Podochytrium sp. JEL0797]
MNNSLRPVALCLAALLVLIAFGTGANAYGPVSQYVVLPLLLWSVEMQYSSGLSVRQIAMLGTVQAAVVGAAMGVSYYSVFASHGALGGLVPIAAVCAAAAVITFAPMHLKCGALGGAPLLSFSFLCAAFQLAARRLSPLGAWGAFAFAADDATLQLASVAGLVAVDLHMAAFAECVVVLMTHRLRHPERETEQVDEQTPLLEDYSNYTPLHHPIQNNSRNAYILLPLLVSLSLWGNARLLSPPSTAPQTYVKIGCVIDHRSFTAQTAANASISDYYFAESTHLASQGAKIISWPESSFQITDPAPLLQRAQEIALQYKSYLGVTYTTPEPNADPVRGMLVNKLTLVGPEGIVLDYTKQHPVPFAETARIAKGKQAVPVVPLPAVVNPKKGSFRDVVVSSAICLDMDFPDVFSGLQTRSGGPQVDLVLSPAGTWDVDVGDLHMRMAKVRAIENGVAVLRCDAKDGVSAFIDAKGREQVVFRGSEMVESFAIVAGFPRERTSRELTTYAVWGDWLGMSVILVAWCLSVLEAKQS